METILFYLFLGALALSIIVPALLWGGIILYSLWPVILGLVVGAIVWYEGADNLGMIIILASIVGQIFWLRRMDDGGTSHDPMSGKAKTYDSKGKVTGYVDKN